MALREVLRMGHPALRRENDDLTVEEILSPETKKLVDDMRETMVKHIGIGLAAPQIGVNKQLAIIEIQTDNERYKEETANEKTPLHVIINPVITILDEQQQGFWEGCLSVPGLRGYVERPQRIRVDYLDLEANEQSLELEGFMATVFQHELDHLEGILYIDRIKDTRMLCFNEEHDKYWSDE